jgi:hypothetical protein
VRFELCRSTSPADTEVSGQEMSSLLPLIAMLKGARVVRM